MAGFAFQRRNERGCGKLFFRKQRDLVMTSLPRVLLVAILLAPVAASGVPSGPANPGGLNNSVNDPSGAGNASKMPTSPGTNSSGKANSSGSRSGTSDSSTGSSESQTTGSALNRAGGQSGGRIDSTMSRGPALPGDAEIRAEDQVVDRKIKSICKGC